MEAVQKAYKPIQAAKLPDIVCVGTVTEVGDAYVSKSGQYIVTPITLTADGAGRNLKFWLNVRPEWFVKNFDPNEIEDTYGSSVDFVYRKNFDNQGRGMPHLKGLLGSEANYVTFRNENVVEDSESFDMLSFSAALREAILKTTVGYILEQDTEKVMDDEGNVERLRIDRYALKRMFFATKDELKRLRNQAERSNGNTLFAAEIPFN